MKLLASLVIALPEILKLLAAIQKSIDEAQTQRKVKEDLQAIERAFREKDANALNHIFNS